MTEVMEHLVGQDLPTREINGVEHVEAEVRVDKDSTKKVWMSRTDWLKREASGGGAWDSIIDESGQRFWIPLNNGSKAKCELEGVEILAVHEPRKASLQPQMGISDDVFKAMGKSIAEAIDRQTRKRVKQGRNK